MEVFVTNHAAYRFVERWGFAPRTWGRHFPAARRVLREAARGAVRIGTATSGVGIWQAEVDGRGVRLYIDEKRRSGDGRPHLVTVIVP